MRLFVTGASGFLGRNLRQAITDHDVYYFRRGESPAVIVCVRPDVIIHLAGETQDERLMVDSNVRLTHDLITSARDVDYRAFVYVGSSSEYGACRSPMRETQPIRPNTTYGATKGCGTLLCMAEAAAGRPACVVRPFSVYGPHEPDGRFIPTILRCWRNREVLPLAPGVHDWIYVDDFVRGLLLIAMSPPEAIRGEIVNLGTGVQTANAEVVRLFEQVAGPVAVRHTPLIRAYDSDCWVADVEHAKTAFGFQVKFDLRSGLRDYVARQN